MGLAGLTGRRNAEPPVGLYGSASRNHEAKCSMCLTNMSGFEVLDGGWESSIRLLAPPSGGRQRGAWGSLIRQFPSEQAAKRYRLANHFAISSLSTREGSFPRWLAFA